LINCALLVHSNGSTPSTQRCIISKGIILATYSCTFNIGKNVSFEFIGIYANFKISLEIPCLGVYYFCYFLMVNVYKYKTSEVITRLKQRHLRKSHKETKIHIEVADE
jgi:hypothetical protein